MAYIASIQNHPIRRFDDLSDAIKYAKSKVYFRDDPTDIAEEIDVCGKFRFVYGHEWGEIADADWNDPMDDFNYVGSRHHY